MPRRKKHPINGETKFLEYPTADTSSIPSWPAPIPTPWYRDPDLLASIITRSNSIIGEEWISLQESPSLFSVLAKQSYTDEDFSPDIGKDKRWKGRVPVLPDPKTPYESLCYLETAHGPYRGYVFECLQFIWPYEHFFSNRSYYLITRGGVLLPWLVPVVTDSPLVQVCLAPFWFDGAVIRTIFIPSPPPLPLVPVAPKRFVLGSPPPVDKLNIFLNRFGYSGGCSFVYIEEEPVEVKNRPRRRYFVPIPVGLNASCLIEDEYQNLFCYETIPYIFFRPTIPPIAISA